MTENVTSIILVKHIKDMAEKELNDVLKSLDITMSQSKTLSILSGHPDRQATLKYLEKELDLAQSVTAGIIVRLEQKNMWKVLGILPISA